MKTMMQSDRIDALKKKISELNHEIQALTVQLNRQEWYKETALSRSEIKQAESELTELCKNQAK